MRATYGSFGGAAKDGINISRRKKNRVREGVVFTNTKVRFVGKQITIRSPTVVPIAV